MTCCNCVHVANGMRNCSAATHKNVNLQLAGAQQRERTLCVTAVETLMISILSVALALIVRPSGKTFINRDEQAALSLFAYRIDFEFDQYFGYFQYI